MAETAAAPWPQSCPQLPATAAGTVELAAASVQLQKCPALRPWPLCPQWQDLGTLQPVTVETPVTLAPSTHPHPHQWQQTLPPGRL